MSVLNLRFSAATFRVLLQTLFPILLLSPAVSAQLPPGTGYVFPPAVRIGETTEVQLGVFDPTDDLQWFVHHSRVQLERTGPISDFHLPPPPYWTGPRGGTNVLPIPREAPARITVAADAEPGFAYWQIANANGSSRTARLLLSRDPEILESRSRDFPQQLPALPVAVSGRLSRLTEVDHYEILATTDGPITVSLMARQLGADFRGILQARNATGELLADFADTQGMDGHITFLVKAGQRYSVSLHDLDFRGDRAYVYRLLFTQTPGSPAQVSPPLSDSPVVTTRPGQTVEIPVPGAVTGQLTPEHAEQRFTFRAVKDQPLQISLQSVGIGGGLDTHLTILTPEGSVAAENDDAEGLTDSSLEFRPAADGTYTGVIRTQTSLHGRTDEVFRLEVRPPVADFSLALPQQLALPSSGQLEVAITARRSGGFDGLIAVQVSGLPPGVTAEGDWSIPAGKSDVKGILKCAADAAVTATAIQVSGTADVQGSAVTRLATATATGNLCPRTPTDKLTSSILLAMTMAPPIDVLVIDRERQRDVPRGSTYPAELEIVRKNGFSGPVTLVMSAQQAQSPGNSGNHDDRPAWRVAHCFPASCRNGWPPISPAAWWSTASLRSRIPKAPSVS